VFNHCLKNLLSLLCTYLISHKFSIHVSANSFENRKRYSPPSSAPSCLQYRPTSGIKSLISSLSRLTIERVDMAKKEPKGAYNRAPFFYDENYDCWKEAWTSISNRSTWMFGMPWPMGGLNHKTLLTASRKTNLRPIGPTMKKRMRETYLFPLGVNEYHSISHWKPIRQCGTLWKLSMRVPNS